MSNNVNGAQQHEYFDDYNNNNNNNDEEQQQQPHFEERQQYDAQYYNNDNFNGPQQLYVDVMSSDGVSTITGPLGHDDFDPVGIYLPAIPPTENNNQYQPQDEPLEEYEEDYSHDEIDDDIRLENTQYESNNLSSSQKLNQSAGNFSSGSNLYSSVDELEDFDPHDIGPADFDPVGNYESPPPQNEPLPQQDDPEYYNRYTAVAAAAAAASEDHDDKDNHSRYATHSNPQQQKPEQRTETFREEHMDDNGRHEYNARVEEWYNTMEETAEQNDDTQTRLSHEDDHGHIFVPTRPQRRQDTSPITVPTTLPPSRKDAAHSFASPSEQRRDRRQSRLCFLIGCLVLFVIVVAVAGVMLTFFTDVFDDWFGSSDKAEGSSKTGNLTEAPASTAPSISPSTSPTPGELEVETLFSLDGPANFGSSVALSSRLVVAGAPSDLSVSIVQSRIRTNQSNTFDRLPAIFNQRGESFGWDLALVDSIDNPDNNDDNTILLVGAPRAGFESQGAAFLYRYIPSLERWGQQGAALTGLGTALEEFGYSVALSKTFRAIVGAPGHDSNRGQVFTFSIGSNGGPLVATSFSATPLVGAGINSRFGESVDISSDGNTLAIGEPGSNTIYIFEWENGEWQKVFDFSLNAQDFGSSVKFISLNYIAAGAPSLNSDKGLIHVFEKTSQGNWSVLPEEINGSELDRLGTRLTISGREGPLGPEVVLGSNSGTVLRYDWIGGRWVKRFSVLGRNDPVSSIASVSSDTGPFSALVGYGASGKVILLGDDASSPDVDTPTSSPSISAPPSKTNVPSASPSLEPSFAPSTSPPPTRMPSMNPSLTPTVKKEWRLVGGPLTSSELGSLYGKAVTIVGDFVIAGAPEAGNDSQGQVLVYDQTSNFDRISLNVALETELFGFALDSNVVAGKPSMIVGARETKANNNFRFGSAHFFEFGDQGWVEVGSPMLPLQEFVESGGEFGGSVAMSSTVRRVAIGAPNSAANFSLVDSGRAYTFEYNGTDWQPLGDMILGTKEDMFLGTSVAMSKDGSRLLIGAPGDDNGDGSVFLYVWDEDASQWTEAFVFRAQGGSQESLGTTVAFLTEDGTMVALGAPNAGGNGQGAVRVYQQGSSASLFDKSIDIGGLAGQRVGTTLSGAQGRVVFGTNDASFRVFENDGSSWGEVATGPSFTSNVTSVAMSKDSNTIVVGLENEQVNVYKYS